MNAAYLKGDWDWLFAQLKNPELETGFAPEAVGYLVFLAVGLSFVGVGLLASWFLRRMLHRKGGASVAYEGGEEPQGSPWIAFQPRYFVVGLVFLVFEIELAFMFPVALAMDKALLLLAFVEGSLFVLLLGVGLVYAWAAGWLTWPSGKAPLPKEWQGGIPQEAYKAVYKAPKT